MWHVELFETRTGDHVLPLQVADGSWESRLSGRGRGMHSVPLQGVPQSLVAEITKGNKYTVCHMWGDHVSFAGVIQRRRYVKRSRGVVLLSAELRSAYMNDRMLFGVDAYAGGSVVLSVSGVSRSGAARAVIDMATNNPDRALPIDLPADGSGSFSAEWKYNERLKVEDHLQQIEDDGCEIVFAPYVSGGVLRWETLVGSPVTVGSPVDYPLDAPGSLVTDFEVDDDYVRQMTGVLAFGKGGVGAPAMFAPATSGAGDISIRDTWVSFPDVDDDSRLQAAADATYEALQGPTAQWSFGVHVWPGGPAGVAPGRVLNLWSYGDGFLPDGVHAKRVIAARGGMGFQVFPEVQDAS